MEDLFWCPSAWFRDLSLGFCLVSTWILLGLTMFDLVRDASHIIAPCPRLAAAPGTRISFHGPKDGVSSISPWHATELRLGAKGQDMPRLQQMPHQY